MVVVKYIVAGINTMLGYYILEQVDNPNTIIIFYVFSRSVVSILLAFNNKYTYKDLLLLWVFIPDIQKGLHLIESIKHNEEDFKDKAIKKNKLDKFIDNIFQNKKRWTLGGRKNQAKLLTL